MTPPLEQSITELLLASRDDEAALLLPTTDRLFGFCAQQSIEKLLKALIAGHEESYVFTHDLGVLLREATALGEQVPLVELEVDKLSKYAGIWRYQRPEALRVEDRERLRELVRNLRVYVQSRLRALGTNLDVLESPDVS